jgi:hypothetical protein
MKQLAFGLALVCSTSYAIAQNTPLNKDEYSRVYAVANKSSLDIYFMASDYAVSKNFTVEKDPVNNSVEMIATMPYEGRFNECIESLDLQARFKLEAKDGKTRIMLHSVSYQHSDKQTGETTSVAKTNMLQQKLTACAPSSGAIEDLFNCKECQQSLNHLDRELKSYFDKVADEYQSYLKSEVARTTGLY